MPSLTVVKDGSWPVLAKLLADRRRKGRRCRGGCCRSVECVGRSGKVLVVVEVNVVRRNVGEFGEVELKIATGGVFAHSPADVEIGVCEEAALRAVGRELGAVDFFGANVEQGKHERLSKLAVVELVSDGFLVAVETNGPG